MEVIRLDKAACVEMGTIRYAGVGDAGVIAGHRHAMFAANGLGAEAALGAMDEAFEPWVRERLGDGRYVGLLLEEGGRVVAGAGVFFADFPPHWMDAQAVRAYVLNVYVGPEGRGMGSARRLMEAALAECRTRGVPTVVLHASAMGRPVYGRMGFTETDEMMLRLDLGGSGTGDEKASATTKAEYGGSSLRSE